MNAVNHDVGLAVARVALELERTRDALAVGLQAFHNGQRLQGARATDVGPGGRRGTTGSGRLVGWSLRAVGGALAVTLRDSRDDSGEVLATINLAADATHTVWLGPGGISFSEGVRIVQSGAGTLEGAIYTGAVD